ncbi:hypothetical protein BDY17DRAFT_127178 [Neohortaea acidophila]|uniref:Secreted protein n=1 Tax=Neohortaea acidophila TaxID=245834 RepID=A0A6A6PXA2_9PEZI|nr:uncharacterized protein BDY17DRAFT_127178 [Neohortaea acidophila]KAF2484386.1 hypothetical protein BDY17DRAFT_127178 [Neohortaea acidophila]
MSALFSFYHVGIVVLFLCTTHHTHTDHLTDANTLACSGDRRASTPACRPVPAFIPLTTSDSTPHPTCLDLSL